ncbi:hypothetical protein [Effusibacillus lacus]|uniref:Uncharacterized protein n=1 Tax=Effusibacillus lacus TaxID=1348429 RepID=A0A292YPQ2_9BACL|nr:hypothetical protein [Effusibacillus lacus]TCS76610.1 hypothetical protein EDD64_102157 [Effusibacillus lacus]GAX90374.1 hypothetical protein EFBL_2000 [Effusibacillus lacus]
MFNQCKLYVNKERVSCPLKGDIDIERCFDCNFLKKLDLEDRTPSVICHGLRKVTDRTAWNEAEKYS